MKRFVSSLSVIFAMLGAVAHPALAAAPVEETVECEVLVVGGGLAGVAAAYEGLRAGRTVCLTEITDWVGGQVSAQGTSALDERPTQRSQLFFPRGYLALRDRIERTYGELNPGDCWVSVACFLPKDGHDILMGMLTEAARQGNGRLKLFLNTVVKDVEISPDGRLIEAAAAIQHQAAPNGPPLNTLTLSQILVDAYQYEDSAYLTKSALRFVPLARAGQPPTAPANWYVIEATETGEVIAIADVPYQVGIDPRSAFEPSASSLTTDQYCTQGFTYTFAMETTDAPIAHEMPSFYPRYAPYYSYELSRLADFDLVFTYRRIWSPGEGDRRTFGGISFTEPTPGDISMQNWTWGNDYRPGTSVDNLVLTRNQLAESGQLAPGGWLGGLRPETLQSGEEHAWGYFYWLVAGTTDSQLGDGVKQPNPNHRFLSGLESPMGTAHGLSKYPYIREGRRIIGRPTYGYDSGFAIAETDISRQNYRAEFYQQALSDPSYRSLWSALAGLDAIPVLRGQQTPADVRQRTRSRIYPDTVGIGHYPIDFHPCMAFSPPEAPGNIERPGERQGAAQTYPFQIPLRAMIPQNIDNLLVAGKSIAVSHIAAAAYRVHGFEWSAGAAAGTTADFALERGIFPYQLVDDPVRDEPQLRQLQQRLDQQGNPTRFPETSIFNLDWQDWR